LERPFCFSPWSIPMRPGPGKPGAWLHAGVRMRGVIQATPAFCHPIDEIFF
jgi:hypothetical protein